MNKKTKEQVAVKLETELETRYKALAVLEPTQEAWNTCMDDIKKLESDLVTIRGTKDDKGSGIDMNTVIQAGVGLASILLILNYEKTDILTSKALPFAMKLIGR